MGSMTEGNFMSRKVKLTIEKSKDQKGFYDVTVVGNGFNGDIGEKVGAHLKGVDATFDDHLSGTGMSGVVGAGGVFRLTKTVKGSRLNEDWGRDEIRAHVLLIQEGEELRSNIVRGRYS